MGRGSGIAVNCGVGYRHGLDPTWLWCRLAAVALIGPLAWEPPDAMGVALKSKKKKMLQSAVFSTHLSSSSLFSALLSLLSKLFLEL